MPPGIVARASRRPIAPTTLTIKTRSRFIEMSFVRLILSGTPCEPGYPRSGNGDFFLGGNRDSVIIHPAKPERPAFLDLCRKLQVRIGCDGGFQTAGKMISRL